MIILSKDLLILQTSGIATTSRARTMVPVLSLMMGTTAVAQLNTPECTVKVVRN